ncbi:MAG: hypothetical protein DWI00_05275 [Planctomycetota bacterium]|nr:MAG: hypothetical protein DWI00_05275 [Planctomycetota bacterium]
MKAFRLISVTGRFFVDRTKLDLQKRHRKVAAVGAHYCSHSVHSRTLFLSLDGGCVNNARLSEVVGIHSIGLNLREFVNLRCAPASPMTGSA